MVPVLGMNSQATTYSPVGAGGLLTLQGCEDVAWGFNPRFSESDQLGLGLEAVLRKPLLEAGEPGVTLLLGAQEVEPVDRALDVDQVDEELIAVRGGIELRQQGGVLGVQQIEDVDRPPRVGVGDQLEVLLGSL